VLRKDPNARFIEEWRSEGPFLRKKKVRYYVLESGKYCSTQVLNEEEFAAFSQQQTLLPVPVMSAEVNRVWWCYRGDFFWENERYTQSEVHALLTERKAQKDKKMQRISDRALSE